MFVGVLMMELVIDVDDEVVLWIVVDILLIYFGFGSMLIGFLVDWVVMISVVCVELGECVLICLGFSDVIGIL